MPRKTLFEEICEATDFELKDDETSQEFAARAFKKIDTKAEQSSAYWDELPNTVQIWTNAAQRAKDDAAKGEEPEWPDIAGFPEEASGGDGEEEKSDEAEAEPETEAEPEEAPAEEAPAEEEGAESDDEGVDGGAEKDEETPSEEEAPARARGKKKGQAKAVKKAVSKPKEKEVRAVAKKAAPAAGKKKAVAKSGGGRRALFSPNARIKLLVDENPHRQGTGRFDRWKKLKDNMTVAKAIEAGWEHENLRYSVADGHIKIIDAA